MPEEQTLLGGVMNPGAVVRVGDTVRRPVRPGAEVVWALLGHLEEVGFTEAPRFLDVDEAGREILSYIPGEVGIPPFPPWVVSEGALDKCGRHEEVTSVLRSITDGSRTTSRPSCEPWPWLPTSDIRSAFSRQQPLRHPRAGDGR
jgi:hypothetical protein